MHLLPRRAGRDGHRRRDDHGSRRLREHPRERRVHRRRHRGSRHRHRHRRDDRPVRRRDDPDDRRLREPDEPSGSAWHPGSGEEASSRDWDGVRRGEVRPDLQADDPLRRLRERRVRDEVHPVREPDGEHRGEGRPVPVRDGEPGARQVRTSTGCYRREAPSDPAWDRDRRESRGRTAPVLRERPMQRGPPVLPGWEPPERVLPDGWVRARRVPALRELPGPRVQPEREPRVRPGLRVRPELRVPAWVRAGVHPAWGRRRTDVRWVPANRRSARTGTTPGGVERPGLPRSTTRTSRTRPAP